VTTANDEGRQVPFHRSGPASYIKPTVHPPLRNEAGFEQWYVENAFNYQQNPIGSQQCGQMRKAWHAALDAIAPTPPAASQAADVEAMAPNEAALLIDALIGARDDNQRQRAYTRLLAALAARNDPVKWQPIETAPKDEKDVLVWAGGRMKIACWSNEDRDIDLREGWFTNNGWRTHPTHWQPAPAAPEE
jgi:hypothetical protein